MTVIKTLVLLLLVAVAILGACAGNSGVGDLPTPDTNLRSAQLVGYQVYGTEGKWLGEVSGVLLDPVTGKVAHLVLFFKEPRVYGRALMVMNPRRFIPIPWARFTSGPQDSSLSLDADEMVLIPAPYLDTAPAALNAAQVQTIDAYWLSEQ